MSPKMGETGAPLPTGSMGRVMKEARTLGLLAIHHLISPMSLRLTMWIPKALRMALPLISKI